MLFSVYFYIQDMVAEPVGGQWASERMPAPDFDGIAHDGKSVRALTVKPSETV